MKQETFFCVLFECRSFASCKLGILFRSSAQLCQHCSISHKQACTHQLTCGHTRLPEHSDKTTRTNNNVDPFKTTILSLPTTLSPLLYKHTECSQLFFLYWEVVLSSPICLPQLIQWMAGCALSQFEQTFTFSLM